jgi:hypothetical protein
MKEQFNLLAPPYDQDELRSTTMINGVRFATIIFLSITREFCVANLDIQLPTQGYTTSLTLEKEMEKSGWISLTATAPNRLCHCVLILVGKLGAVRTEMTSVSLAV